MTREELAAALRKADAAGNTDDARRLAGAIRQLDASAVSAPTPVKPAPMSQPDATPWGDGQAFDDMYARKPQTDPMLSPLRPNARTLTSGQPTRLKPPPAPRGPVMSPAQRTATQPDRDEAARVRKYNEELALMNAASPIPFKNTGPDGPLELNQERPDLFAGRATGAFVNSNIGVANTLGQLGLSTANAFGAAGDPSMQGALAGGEYGDITQRVADAAQQGGYVQNQQAIGDILPSLPIPAPTTAGEMAADVTGNLASVFTGFGAPILKGGKALSESLATVPGMSRALRGVGVETGENAALAYGLSAGAAPAGSDRNMAGTQGAADPLNYVSIEAARAVPRALKALDAPTTPTNAGGANLRQPAPQLPPVAPTVAATQNAQQAPIQPQTATAPPVPPIPPNAPAVTAGAAQPVPARPRAEQRADDIFMKKMEADGVSVDDLRKIQARLARRGDSGVYETSGEIAAMTDNSSGANLRGLQMAGGAAPGPLQEALVGLVNQNTDKLSSRLSRGATRATGQKADNAVATLDELENRLRTEAGPAYDTAYATPVDPQVFANELVPVLNTPSGQKALQSARNNLASVAADLQARAARGASERAMMESQRAQAAVKSIDDYMADPVRGTAIPTTMALDYTKRAFDDVIADAGFGSDTARIVGATKRNFADSVSQATGGEYGNALGVFEDVKRLEDAFAVGTEALNKKTWQLERDIAKGRAGSPWTAGEVEALAMGVARNIEDMIEANNQSALTKLLKDKALKNVATALGSQKAADMFEETIRRLGANREWGRRVAGGSDTAMRQAAIRDAGMEGEDALTRVLDRVETSGNQFSLPGLVNDVAVKPLARAAKEFYRHRRYPGVYDEEVNRALIPLIGKPMTEANLNEVIRRVEARMAEKGLIPPVQPAAAQPPPLRTRGTRRNPPGTTSSASAPITGMVAGGIGGAMVPADDENQQLMNALFGAAGGAAVGGIASKLSKGVQPPKPRVSPPPVGGRAPPVRMGFGGKPPAGEQYGFKHLDAIKDRLAREQGRLGEATTAKEREFRAVRVSQAEKELANEIEFLKSKGIAPPDEMSVDDLAAELEGLDGFSPAARKPEQAGFGGSRDLPMDEASRMSRAREQGFDVDTPLYHGTASDFDEFRISEDGNFGPGVYLTRNPQVASQYAAKASGPSGKNVRPVYVRGKLATSDKYDDVFVDVAERFPEETNDQLNVRAVAILKKRGYAGIDGDGQISVFDPSNIRGKFAKFDPAESGSSKLLAGMGGNSRGIADNLKQDAALAAFGSVGGSFANQDDPQAGALAGMGLALGGKYGPRAVNAMRGAGRVKPPPVRGADQATFGGEKPPGGPKTPLSNVTPIGKAPRKPPEPPKPLYSPLEQGQWVEEDPLATLTRQIEESGLSVRTDPDEYYRPFSMDNTDGYSQSDLDLLNKATETLSRHDGISKTEAAELVERNWQSQGNTVETLSGIKTVLPFSTRARPKPPVQNGFGSGKAESRPKGPPGNDDYRGQHQASDMESGAPLHDVTANGIYPEDFYGPNGLQYYAPGHEGGMDAQTYAAIRAMRGKPNAMVRVYRAVPKREATPSEMIAALQAEKRYIQKTGKTPVDAKLKAALPVKNSSQYYDRIHDEIERLSKLPEDTVLQEKLKLNAGDWVALSRKYAKDHGEGALNGDYEIISELKPAKELYTSGDSFQEWGWSPSSKATTSVPQVRRPKPPPQTMGFGGMGASRPKPPPAKGPPKPGVSPPKGPGTLSRMVTGGAIGGLAGGVAGEADPQTAETAQKIADNKALTQAILADIAKIEGDMRVYEGGDPLEMQKTLNRRSTDGSFIREDGNVGPETTAAIGRDKTAAMAALKEKRERLAQLELTGKELEQQAAFERTRPTEDQQFMRDYAPLLGGIAGAAGAKLARIGGTTVSKFTAKSAIKKANALLNTAPISPPVTAADRAAIRKRVANVNEFWKRGGANQPENFKQAIGMEPKRSVPFESNQRGLLRARPLAKVVPPDDLFPDRFIGRKLGAMDALIGGSAATEAVLAAQNAEMIAEKLKTARETLEDDKTEANMARVQELEDQYAQAKALMMLGIGAGVGTGLGVAFTKYASKRADVPMAEQELAILRQYLASQKKPPAKLSPRKKPTTPPPLPPSRPRRNQRPPKP